MKFLFLSIFLCSCLQGPVGPTGPQGNSGQNGTINIVGDSLVCTNSHDSIMCLKVVKGDQGVQGSSGVGSIENEIKNVVGKIKKYKSAIIVVECFEDSNFVLYKGHATGTFTLINDSLYVITTDHTTLNLPQGKFKSFKYKSNGILVGQTNGEKFKIINNQMTKDIIGIVVDSIFEHVDHIPMKTSYNPQIGDLNIAVGYPLNILFDPQFLIGFVSDDDITKSIDIFSNRWHEAYTTNIPSAGGSSGSPVFDREGNWVGIIVGGYEMGLELTIQMPLR